MWKTCVSVRVCTYYLKISSSLHLPWDMSHPYLYAAVWAREVSLQADPPNRPIESLRGLHITS